MTERVDATERQTHYGSGRQPWDEIIEQGWAAQFAAGNILKYLRRDKAREHSLSSAKWYWQRLGEMQHVEDKMVQQRLSQLLTRLELDFLNTP